MTPESRLKPSFATVLTLAARQHGVVTRVQLLDAGLSGDAIRHRVRKGRLWSVYRDVFAVGRPELTREGRWMAAVLACGVNAALSHLSAAALWRIWEGVAPRWPHVSVPTQAGRHRLEGIALHRTATLTADDMTTHDGIPVTTLSRTLLDLAGILNPRQLKSALRQSERLHDLDLPRLSHALDVLPPSNHKRARLAKVLETYLPAPKSTEPEADFRELCAAHGIPLPETQVQIGPYRVDFLWPDERLVVEVDDRASHDGYVPFLDDRVRDRYLRAKGFEVLRFTATEVAVESANVARETKTARSGRAVP